MEQKEKFIELLNTAFEREYNEVFLYLREAELFRDKVVSGDEIGELFDRFSSIELRHSDRVAAKLLELGTRPVWAFRPLESSSSLKKVLEKHVVAEAEAVKLYDKIVGICADPDFRIILKGIREEEKEHLGKAARILKSLKS